MLNIGCHLSSAKGYLHMGEEALALGAPTPFSFLHVIHAEAEPKRSIQRISGLYWR